MATRTSHSSPCFLRVAEASAASSASKITSLSTPFSLETASTTIRISLFTSVLPHVPACAPGEPRPPLGREPCPADLSERHRDLLAVDLERNPGLVHGEELAGVTAAAGARLLELHEHPRADKASEVRLGAQHPVESRRGHLQRVRARYRILDIEERGDLAAHLRAVIERDAGFPVDEQPQHRERTA